MVFVTEDTPRAKHDDLIRLLHKLATDAGAKVDINTSVESVQAGTSDPRPSVTLLNGNVLHADIVIGADGNSSIVRKAVFEEGDTSEPSGLTVYSGIIDVEKMLSDPELRPLAKSDDVRPDRPLIRETMLMSGSGLSG